MQSGREPAAEKSGGPPLRLARAFGLLATLKRPPSRPLTVLEAETGFPRRRFLCSRPGAFRTKPETREQNALVITPEMRPEPLHQRCHAKGLQIIVEVFPVRHKQPH